MLAATKGQNLAVVDRLASFFHFIQIPAHVETGRKVVSWLIFDKLECVFTVNFGRLDCKTSGIWLYFELALKQR